MQYIKIDKYTTLDDLSRQVGRNNLDTVLHLNGLKRVPNIGDEYEFICNEIMSNTTEVDTKKKLSVLNTLAGDYDVFEKASLQSEDEWKILSYTKSLPGTLKVPNDIHISEDAYVYGNNIQVPSHIYQKTMNELKETGRISGSSFNEYDSSPSTNINREYTEDVKVFQWFKIPWGEVILYSSLSDSFIEFPVYPEEVSDSRSATYTTMPDLLYQYEPWQIYLSSGPRENSYTFHFHRDMWTGDHGDGKANELIRFCQATPSPR